MPRKPPYAEGDWIAVPLGDDRWVAGRIARMDGRNTIFGYFFPTVSVAPPALDDIAGLSPSDSFTQLIFSDLDLRKGDWRLLGGSPGFRRDEWPMVEFERYLDLSLREPVLQAVAYADDNPNVEVSCRRVPMTERGGRPIDGLYGSGAAVTRLRMLLDRQAATVPSPVPETNVGPIHERDAVIIRLDTRDVGDPGTLIDELQDVIEQAVRESGAGEYDGLVRNEEETTLYLYGDDAAQLWRVVSDTLATLPPVVRVSATARQAGTERPLGR